MSKSFIKLDRARLLAMGHSEAEVDAMLARPGGKAWTTVKVLADTRDLLAKLAAMEGASMGALVARLVEEYRREKEGDQT